MKRQIPSRPLDSWPREQRREWKAARVQKDTRLKRVAAISGHFVTSGGCLIGIEARSPKIPLHSDCGQFPGWGLVCVSLAGQCILTTD